MNRLLSLFVVIWLLGISAYAADDSVGYINWERATVRQALIAYKDCVSLELVVDSRVNALESTIALEASATSGKMAKLVEKALLEQAGIVITPLEGGKASVTYNDALPVKPALVVSKANVQVIRPAKVETNR